MTIIEMIAAGKWHRNAEKYSGRSRHTSINADRDIKVCKTCRKVFEIYGIGAGKYTAAYYKDFPTYGKSECECPRCRFSRDEETFIAWDRGRSTILPRSRFCAGYKERIVRRQEKAERLRKLRTKSAHR